jgi:glycosyltransferase involved in cell wall biosynthesis
VHQKGFDLLIEAFAIIASQNEQLRLAIAGEGPDLQLLRDLAARLDLAQRVSFLGPIKNLSAVMRKADVFVLSSRYEGFPNVLLEALASGVPVVSTDCPSGPREILGDGSLGLLVPCGSAKALAEAVMRVISDAELHRRLSAPGVARRYELGSVITAWETLLAGRPA